MTSTYVNYVPVAATATPQTAAEARNASILLVGTDDNSFDHPLTFKICKLPDIGTLYSPSGAVLTVNSVVAASSSSAYSSQVYVTFYIPNNNNGFNVDYFTYSVNDGHADSTCFSGNVTNNYFLVLSFFNSLPQCQQYKRSPNCYWTKHYSSFP